MNSFSLEILTPDGTVYSGEAESLLIRTDGGDVEFLRGHANFFAPLAIGRARIIENGNHRLASVQGGFVSVVDGAVRVCATTFEFAENIDLNRAKAAREKAEQLISRANDERSMNIAKAKLCRAINRIDVKESLK